MANSSRSERQADRKSGQSARASSPHGLFASAPMRPKLDEALAKQIAEQRAEDWLMRLSEAFADGRRYKKSLPLAEEAVASCPDAIVLMLFAVNAALFEGKIESGQALLKRFDSRGTAPAAELLRAIAQHMGGRTSSAKYTLERAKLTEWQDLYRAFPGGYKRLRWLQDHIDEILHGRPARPSRTAAVAKSVAANKGTPKSAPAAKLVTAPKIDDVKVASEFPDDTARTALTSLPMIEVALPFSLKFDSAPLLSALPLILDGKRQSSGTEGGFNAGSGDCARWFNLRERLNHLSLVQGFDELLCESQLVGLQPLWHQIETVRKVLRQFHGRVLLADEVGLGKTIEACMVLKEYAMRGMAERALILTPASLVGQWREELETKFGLQFATTYDPLSRDDPAAFWAQKHVVASIATARRREHADHLAANNYDIVIVDEAHHLKDRTSQSWKLVDALNKRFLLLLSATPVQNDLVELYNLLTLLKPGIFKTPKEFRLAHMTPGKPRVPANPEALRTLMRDAMIRNTRAVVALKLPRRQASTLKVDGAPGETAAYAALTEAARALAAKEGGGRQRLTLHHLLTAAGSSPRAALAAVSRMAEREPKSKVWPKLAQQWAKVGRSGKEQALLDLLKTNPSEKKIVFVQARETLEHLSATFDEAGISYARFDGNLSGPEKDGAIEQFRNASSVLLCTQSGGEGRNIQFCNTLINFDVPWNPMAIEQRIGRIDRIGQEREVFVFNLVTKGTLEEQVLVLLDEKIAMFELVVGEVGAILGGLEEDREFPDLVVDAWLAATDAERVNAFGAIGDSLTAARQQHDGAKALDETLFGEDFDTA